MKVKAFLSTFILAGLCVAGGPAIASNLGCGGISVHNATQNDVTLDGGIADGCVISGVNPFSGAHGDASGFSASFGTAPWTMLSKVTGSSVASATSFGSLNGVDYKFDFTETNTKTGTWTVTVSKPVTVDLVFAMHAANRSGAFFFDDQVLTKSSLGNTGTWVINWYNKGSQVPDFSNLTIFARDQHVSAVPEPETYGMLLAGLGLVGFMARRRKQK